MKGKRLLIAGAAFALAIGAVACITSHRKASQVCANTVSAFSFTRATSTDSVSNGYEMVLENYKGNADNYQDKNATVGLDIGVKKTSGTIWTTAPSSISLTVRVGGGSTRTLNNNLIANLIDSDGNEISNTSTVVTEKVEVTTGKDYVVSVPVAANAAGIMLHHAKESSYNIRVYEISLSFEEAGGGGDTPTETLIYTLSSSIAGSGNAYAGTNTATQSGIEWKVNGNIEMDPWRIGGKSIEDVDRSIYSTSAMPYNVDKIEIQFGAASNITVNSFTVGVYSTASDAANRSNAVATFTPSFVPSHTTTIEKLDSTSWDECFYNITLNVTNTTTNNRFVEFISAKFYELEGGNPEEVFYTVSFNSLGGGDFDSLSIKEGKHALELPTPSKPNNTTNQIRYEFEGWYTVENPNNPVFVEANRFTTSTPVESDLVLYANYDSFHYNIVSFNSNGGSAVESQNIDDNETAHRVYPSKADNVFSGWYTTSDCQDGTEFNFATPITSNVVLYAKWTPINIRANGYFVKVTSTEDLVDGDKYLIVDETEFKAFNGWLYGLDVASNNVDVAFQGSNIKKDSNTQSAYFVINEVEDGKYSIKSASGEFIGSNSYANGLNTTTTLSDNFKNSISFDDDDNVVISVEHAEGDVQLRYNNGEKDQRFRYYKSGQQAIQLYRYVFDATDYLADTYAFSTLSGTETGEGDSYRVTNIGLRFGAVISKSSWDTINSEREITNYGLMLVKRTTLDSYHQADNTISTIEDAFKKGKSLLDRSKTYYGDFDTPAYDSETGYYFTLKINVSDESDHSVVYCAAPYIVAGGQYYFLQQIEYSVNSLATELTSDDNYPYLSTDALDYLSIH